MVIMKSINFEFLRAQRPVLADLGGFAETYAHADAQSAMVKVRVFLEDVVDYIYLRHKLARPYTSAGKEPHLDDLLNGAEFVKVVPSAVRSVFHTVRIASNPGAHKSGLSKIGPSDALTALRDLHGLAAWLWTFAAWGASSAVPKWSDVPSGGASGLTKAKLQEEKASALQKLSEAESAVAKMRAELLSAQQTAEAAKEQAALTQAQLEALLAEAEKAATAIGFDEHTTRRALIDTMLAAAGWEVGEHGASTEAVGQEVKLKGYSSKSGNGVADYVLYGDDGRPLAVVEAKRTSVEVDQGREQAKGYADALEKQHGQRPIIYCTNGFELTLWDDARNAPPRRVYGFHSPDSLAWMVQQRTTRKILTQVSTSADIAGRMFQLEAIQRVCERFESGHRRALIVLATGTGKTRVAISLCDRLLRAGYARRVLFLCDRKELRKQALNAFKTYLPDEPRTIIDGALDEVERKKNRVFVATYPAMMKCYAAFDAGFFDVVIADESHRSIYNRYRDLFLYFDALQVGLTATPVRFVERNTYKLFGCEPGVPTAAFTLDEAIAHQPPYLVPPKVMRVDTKFLREGLKYSQMSAEQRAEVEEDQDEPEGVEYEAGELDDKVFNKDTSRRILRNLMENGLRDSAATRVGKSIVFARNHKHAKFLEALFHELYPDLGGSFCRVIDNHEPLAEKLIDEFKTPSSALRVAISVDMLDTGIDVPEVVNLVFARPVRSYVKFWQMIGRGTRLCDGNEERAVLFAPGTKKSHFMVFDHWDNFGFFEEAHQEEEPKRTKSLLQLVFEARVDLAEVARDKADESVFEHALTLVASDLNDLIACRSVSVDEKRATLLKLARPEALKAFGAMTRLELREEAAPLMQWRKLDGEEDAWRFDLVVTEAQVALLRGASRFADLKEAVTASAGRLLHQHSEVKARADVIAKLASKEFWSAVTVADLEAVRESLRGVMKHHQEEERSRPAPRVIDVTDEGEEHVEVLPKLEGLDLVLYRERVQKVLREHFDRDPVLSKIRRGEPVLESDLIALCELVIEVDDKANIFRLAGRDPDTRTALLHTLRGLVGMDPSAVDRTFTAFVQTHSKLSSRQMQFLQLLKSHVVQHGGLTLSKLYDAPFTSLHAEGIDGVFAERERDEILAIVRPFVVEEAS